jgi:Ca2+-transporting ATPase
MPATSGGRESDKRTPDLWHAATAASALERLAADPEAGLAEPEVDRRLERYGPNSLPVREGPRWYALLARQYADVLIGILAIAAAVSVLIGEWTDAAAILAILIFNGILGFAQEWRAARAIRALQQMLAPRCTVVREGRVQTAPSASLVPGDLVVISTGARVPADLRLLTAVDLRIDESALTGESEPVDKSSEPVGEAIPVAERSSMAWMGTAVTAGRARGVVTATGLATEFGRIAELTRSVPDDRTPLQRKLASLGRQLAVLAVSVSAGVGIAGWWLGKPALDMFMTGVSLAVAIVPEGLPAVVTITLALGVRAMVRRRALLRRLPAAETLGSTTVICTDKTGTLTENEMTVRRVWLAGGELVATGTGYDPEGAFTAEARPVEPASRPDLCAMLETGLACNHTSVRPLEGTWRALGEPTEAALVVAALKAGLVPTDGFAALAEFPFSSDRKRMTIVDRGAGGPTAHTKGAPEVILARCTRILDPAGERELRPAERRAATEAYEDFAKLGLRTLALARRDLPQGAPLQADAVETDLTLLGIVGILDPPRPEVKQAIAIARSAGIHVVMITGDAAPTALAIAQRVGLADRRAVTGHELDAWDDDALRRAIEDEAVFARTTPEHKLRIVSALQAIGHVVAMTGDGVNDAPALKKADIGIAMGVRGTDVAKGASDMVLTDDNFASIVGAVEEGRRQYDNIQKFVRYLLSSNSGEMTAIFLNIVLGGPLIFIPVQILWMNLVTDGVLAVALGVEPVEAGSMDRPPRSLRDPLLNRGGAMAIAAIGAYIGIATLALFHLHLGDEPGGLARAQTIAFSGIIMFEQFNVLNWRALRAPLASVGWLSNPWVPLAISIAVGIQLAAVYTPIGQAALHTVPLSLADWMWMLALGAPLLVACETVKRARWRG